jgi:hypothetical protein
VNSTGSYDVTSSDPTYFRLSITAKTNGPQSIWLIYDANLGWVKANFPMPVGSIGERSVYGKFTLVTSNLTIQVDTGIYPYNPRMGQLVNATNPAGNGTYTDGIYEITVKPLPDKTVVELTFTWEPEGIGTATLIIVSTVAVVVAGVIYARRKLKR